MDHDQRLKTLIKVCFREFFELFFDRWAARLDFSEVEFLNQETFPDPPEGDRHLLDIVAKLKTRESIPLGGGTDPEELLALIHIEIESLDRATNLRPRFKDYYLDLRREHGLPVLPIAVYLKVGLDGIGVDGYAESFWELETLRVQFLYVGLPALDAVEYVRRENPLGWALISLMKIPKDRMRELGREAFELLRDSSLPDQKRYLLMECLDAYLPLDGKELEEFHRLFLGSSDSGVKAMHQTYFEKLRAEGRNEGRNAGIEESRTQSLRDYRQTLSQVLRERFGAISADLLQRIENLSWDEVTTTLLKAIKVNSPDQLFE